MIAAKNVNKLRQDYERIKSWFLFWIIKEITCFNLNKYLNKQIAQNDTDFMHYCETDNQLKRWVNFYLIQLKTIMFRENFPSTRLVEELEEKQSYFFYYENEIARIQKNYLSESRVISNSMQLASSQLKEFINLSVLLNLI